MNSPSYTESVRTAALVILTMIAGTAVLYVLKPILIPLLIAAMVTYILSPLVELLAKYKIPRLLTLLVIYLIAFGVLGKLIELLVSNIISFTQNLPEYKQQIVALVEFYTDQYPWLETSFDDLITFVFGLPIGSYANSVVNSSVLVISNVILILLFVTYLSLAVHTYPNKILRAFAGSEGERILKVSSSINDEILKYVGVHTLISLATGISVGVVCWILGVPFAFLWGFIAFVLNYVPTIGSIISSIPPIITAFVMLGVVPALWVTVLVFGVQMVWGNVVEPKVAGTSLGISPLVILLSLVFWGWLWGVVGAILAVPIASIIKITCKNIKHLQPIAALMDDQ